MSHPLWVLIPVALILIVKGALSAAIAWFLKFLVRHSMYWFVGYRIIVGVTVLILLSTGVIGAQ